MDVLESLGDRPGILTGWGITEEGVTSDVLLQVLLPLVDIESCNSTYGNLLVTNQVRKRGWACQTVEGWMIVIIIINIHVFLLSSLLLQSTCLISLEVKSLCP